MICEYPLSKICKVLNKNRSLVYYHKRREKNAADDLTQSVIKIFNNSNGNYGARKIREELRKLQINTSRRRIRRIMKENFLISAYATAYFKVRSKSSDTNRDAVENIVNREFSNRKYREVVVSDLTYVRVDGRWNYICFLTDLFNREILSYAVGTKKDAGLVHTAFMQADGRLDGIKYFHTDRGSEFKNQKIDKILNAFGIQRSLSHPGLPYDNAVAESLYKATKVEFVRGKNFKSLAELKSELFEYVHWYNNKRIHQSLGYLTPMEFKQKCMVK